MTSVPHRLQKGADLVGALMFFAIFLLFLLQIVARYVFQWPIGWPDETIAFLFVWVSFWGGALMVPLERHITFDLVDNALPARVARWTRIATLGGTAALFLAAIPVTLDFAVFSHRQTTPVVRFPLSAVYAPVGMFLAVVSVRLGVAAWLEFKTGREVKT